jgi:hypothetical protein
VITLINVKLIKDVTRCNIPLDKDTARYLGITKFHRDRSHNLTFIHLIVSLVTCSSRC